MLWKHQHNILNVISREVLGLQTSSGSLELSDNSKFVLLMILSFLLGTDLFLSISALNSMVFGDQELCGVVMACTGDDGSWVFQELLLTSHDWTVESNRKDRSRYYVKILHLKSSVLGHTIKTGVCNAIKNCCCLKGPQLYEKGRVKKASVSQ